MDSPSTLEPIDSQRFYTFTFPSQHLTLKHPAEFRLLNSYLSSKQHEAPYITESSFYVRKIPLRFPRVLPVLPVLPISVRYETTEV